MRGEGGVTGEGRVVGVPKFHSWSKCTMPLMNINSGWMFNASSGLRINLLAVKNKNKKKNYTPSGKKKKKK